MSSLNHKSTNTKIHLSIPIQIKYLLILILKPDLL